jgi:hypothetical protein
MNAYSGMSEDQLLQQLERLNEVMQRLENLVPSLAENQLAVQRG